MEKEKEIIEQSKFLQALELNVNKMTEKKNGLTYLSWAPAWQEFKKIYTDATYQVKRYGEAQLPYVVDETGYMVATEVTADGVTHEMWLPVMNHMNQALKRGNASMFDVNKAIMRCFTKNLAMFGLGLYIYTGEDLPEATDEIKQAKTKTVAKPVKPTSPKQIADKAYKAIEDTETIEGLNAILVRLGQVDLEAVTKDTLIAVAKAKITKLIEAQEDNSVPQGKEITPEELEAFIENK